MRIKVYTMLTLDRSAVRALLPGATVALPIQRGDLVADIRSGVHVVAMIDGAFEQSMAVSPSEVLAAIRAGVRVYGASSMGALRAAELDQYGMVGYGRIYEQIKRSEVFRDDFLGQLFAVEGKRIRALSVTFTDFEFALLGLLGKGKITRKDTQLLLNHYRRLFYTDRHFPGIRKRLEDAGLSRLVRFARLATDPRLSQKGADAIGLLKKIRGDLKQTARLNRVINR
jgi:hypothetical protein